MSVFLEYGENIKITIPRSVEGDKCTLYEIHIEVRDVNWTVTHRYSEFSALHDKLVSDHGVTKDLLPPKRLLNKDPVFIEKRRFCLEAYLVSVIRYLEKNLPQELALFLHFHEYDVFFVLQRMSIYYFDQGDSLLARSKGGHFTPLELHSITWRLKQPCPVLEIIDQKRNFSHVLDFCTQLKDVYIRGSNTLYKTSNIILNKMTYDLNVFKNLSRLTFIDANVNCITGLGNLREKLEILNIYNCQLGHLSTILLCDTIHKEVLNIPVFKWAALVELHVVNNHLRQIDDNIKLLPNLKLLNLENNNLSTVTNLQSLTKLVHVNLSCNNFTNVEDLSTELAHVTYLNMSQNQITSLKAFTNLKFLNTLDLQSNKITELEEIVHITGLRCLENLILTGNPLSIIVDYRTRVLEQFDNRAQDLCLDNEKSTQKELDKVAILQAIRISQIKRANFS